MLVQYYLQITLNLLYHTSELVWDQPKKPGGAKTMSTKESKEGMVLENQTIAREDHESVCNLH